MFIKNTICNKIIVVRVNNTQVKHIKVSSLHRGKECKRKQQIISKNY